MNRSTVQALIVELNTDIEQAEAALLELRQLRELLERRLTTELFSQSATIPQIRIKGTTDQHQPMTQAQAAEQVLLEADGPLSTQEIVNAILERGYYESESENFSSAVHAAMSREPEKFTKIGRGVWDLTARISVKQEERMPDEEIPF